MTLRTALANIHADRHWWRTVLIGGALMLTLIGVPVPWGLAIDSLHNSQRGFPTPLPPIAGVFDRVMIGLFGLLIDFLFFLFPIMVFGLIFACVLFGIMLSTPASEGNGRLWLLLVPLLVWHVAMFALGVAPIGRLLFIGEGGAQAALSGAVIREALRPAARAAYGRARLLSLPAYLPAVLLGALVWVVSNQIFAAKLPVVLLLLWLLCCALFYAHLVVAQLYAAASRIVRLP